MGTRMNFREILWSCFRRTAPEQAAMCPPQVVRIHEPKGARAPTKTASTKQPETAGNSRKTPENAGKRRKRAVRNSRKTPDNTRGRPLEPPRQGVAVTSDRSLICGTSCWTWLMFRGAAMWDTCEHRSWVREKGCCSGGDAYSGAGGVRRDAGGQQVLLPWYCC